MQSVLRSLLCVALVASSYNHVPGAQAANCLVPCTKEYEPVCGSDGKTYRNKCELQCSPDFSLTLMSTGECLATSTRFPGPTVSPSLSPSSTIGSPSPSSTAGINCDNVACPAFFGPVCGSDGKIYDSDCSLRIAQCKTTSLNLALQGECPGYGSSSMYNSSSSSTGGDSSTVGGGASGSLANSSDAGATKKPETKSGAMTGGSTSAISLVVAMSVLFLCAFAE